MSGSYVQDPTVQVIDVHTSTTALNCPIGQKRSSPEGSVPSKNPSPLILLDLRRDASHGVAVRWRPVR